MKNKFILSFLLIPVFVACQNTVNVSSSSSSQPSKSSISTNIVSSTPTNSVLVSASPSVSIIPKVTPQPIPSYIQDSSLVYSNMIENISKDDFNYPELPKQPKNLEVAKINGYKGYDMELPIKYVELSGTVYDLNNNPVPDANIEIENTKCKNNDFERMGRDYYCLNSFKTNIKTNDIGKYKVSLPEYMWVAFKLSKLNYTTRVFYKYVRVEYQYDEIFDIYTVDKAPEIYQVNINKQRVRRYDRKKISNSELEIKKDVFTSEPYSEIVRTETIYPRFKLSNINKLEIELYFNKEIELYFNNPIKTNNLLPCLSIINADRTESNCLEINKYKWTDNNKNLFFDIKLINYKEDKKYRLKFNKPFIDILDNLPIKNSYFGINEYNDHFFTELSENIVFEIAGSK